MRKRQALNLRARENARQVFYIILSMAAAFLVAAVFIAQAGVSPLTAFWSMLRGVVASTRSVGEVMRKATPIILVGLGVCVCLSGGLPNLGGDGQILIGGLAAAMTGIWLDGVVPYQVLFFLVLLAGVLFGGLWGSIAGLFKICFGMSTIIVTIMLNYIATNLILFCVEGPLKGEGVYLPQTATVPKALWLAPVSPNSRVHFGFVIALILAGAIFFILKRMVLGYRIRAIGQAPKAAVYAGVREKPYAILLMFIAGAFAGLAGAVEVYGVHYKVLDGIASGYGFLGISAALLAQRNPLGLILTSIFFGALTVGANVMQVQVSIPSSIVGVTQGIIILFMMISPGIASAIYEARQRRGARAGRGPEA